MFFDVDFRPSNTKQKSTLPTWTFQFGRHLVPKGCQFTIPLRLNWHLHWKVPITMYTWNPNDPWFFWTRPCLGGFTFKTKGHHFLVGWFFTNPSEKYDIVKKWIISPKFRGTYLKFHHHPVFLLLMFSPPVVLISETKNH